ncbi:DUF2333 family protein [Halomonas binhaiensis]|uniref:DUF2333 family protein n=1 Tax=Halomonas binhaiensis TaxID=2562282 RepID=A0A856QNG7_9GAMM|nr:DUF2333 family protein [Halomonas binhaiensis]QEM81480.2 DUF2333 family protein [Halomonas binhaiensis]
MISRRLRDERRREQLETPQYGWIWKPLAGLAILVIVVVAGLTIWWSLAPSRFDVNAATLERREAASADAKGAMAVATLAEVVDTLLDKPGGYLRDDILPPGLLMDNMSSWEAGVLSQARLLGAALPKLDAQAGESVAQVNELLQGDDSQWFGTSTGKRLADASTQLDTYLAQFSTQGGSVFDSAGLKPWLESVRDELQRITLRLSASVEDIDSLKEMGISVADVPQDADVPWYHVDNDFHQARGEAWALILLLEAVYRDEQGVIAAAGLDNNWQRLLAELERTQRQLWSPVVLRGSGFGIFANYPLTMAHQLSRAGITLDMLIDDMSELPEEPHQGKPAGQKTTRSFIDEVVTEQKHDQGSKQDKAADSGQEQATESEQDEAANAGQEQAAESEQGKAADPGQEQATESEQDKAANAGQEQAAESEQGKAADPGQEQAAESEQDKAADSSREQNADSEQGKAADAGQEQGDSDSEKKQGAESEQGKPIMPGEAGEPTSPESDATPRQDASEQAE